MTHGHVELMKARVLVVTVVGTGKHVLQTYVLREGVCSSTLARVEVGSKGQWTNMRTLPAIFMGQELWTSHVPRNYLGVK